MSTIDVSTQTSAEEMVLAHFIVSDDVERSRRFYTDVLGGKTVIGGEQGDEVTYIALANSWIIINVGGGPTDDKPTVTLETPAEPDRVSSFLNIRVRGHSSRVRRVECAGRSLPDATETTRNRDALLHSRSRRIPDRGGSDNPGQRLAAAILMIGVTKVASPKTVPRPAQQTANQLSRTAEKLDEERSGLVALPRLGCQIRRRPGAQDPPSKDRASAAPTTRS